MSTKDYLANLKLEPGDKLDHGVKGQRWGIRKSDAPSSLAPKATDHPVTKQTKSDYNTMSGKEFFRKYATTKGTYARRVEKHGDPFVRASKVAKKLPGGKKEVAKVEGPKPPPKAPANESSADRYNRLRSQIKTHGANSLEPDDLNFVTSRTEAIAKINKMNVTSPGWLTDASKVVVQETTKTLMKDLAVRAGKEYIIKPLITGK